MRLNDLDKTSIKYYLSEDLKKDSSLNEHWDRIDNEFFKPWQRYLNEATLTPDQINQMFAAAEKETSAGGGNSSMLGKIVDKVIPSAFLSKLEKSLPEPDPNAQPDPEFEAKASAAVQQLQAPAETKTGLMAIIKAAVKNPQVQAMVLSLVGGVLGGLVQAASPLIQSIFPGGGTAVVAITGAIVAGGVAIAAAKLQGKGWKEAFKGAIKPALAGAAGAVIGNMAAQFASGAVSMAANAVKGGGAPAGGDTSAANTAMNADKKMIADLQKEYPPDKFEFSGSGKSVTVIDRATGQKVQTFDGLQGQSMDTKTLADLANDPNKAISAPPGAGQAGTSRGGDTIADRTARAEDARQNAISDGASPQEANEIAAKMMKYGTVISAGQGRGNVYQKPGLESVERTGKNLSEGQVYLVFNRIVTRNNYLLTEGRLAEGPMDWLKTKAKNLTTKVTADKLNTAWQKAGSPTDSEQLKKFLTDQGVATEVVDKVYTDMKLPAAGAEKPVDTAELEKQINTFDTKQKQDILAYLTQSLRTA